LVWRDPFERFEPSSEIVGIDKVAEMRTQLVVAIVVESFTLACKIASDDDPASPAQQGIEVVDEKMIRRTGDSRLSISSGRNDDSDYPPIA
jgi:hypothetical protein